MSFLLNFFLLFSLLNNIYSFDFPSNHSFHKDYNVEWVYFVGQIESKDKKKFGFELSFFKGKITNEIEVFPVHFAISDLENKIHYQSQTIEREFGNLGKYNFEEIRSGDYSVKILSDRKFKLIAKPRGQNFSLELDLTSTKDKIILHGKNGFSIKSRKNPEYNSNYYSISDLSPKGELNLNSKKYSIESGYVWMDHEWSKSDKNSSLSSNEVSWDWFGINFDDGSVLMCFNFRKNNLTESESFGTFINSKKEKFYFEKENEIKIKKKNSIWKSPKSNKSYSLNWEIEFLDYKVLVEPIFSEQEFIALETTGNIYWEGAVKSSILQKEKFVSGKGYMELKGY